MPEQETAQPRYVIETEAEAIASGSFWWWGPECVPGWNPEKDAAQLRRELQRGVISLSEAIRLHRNGLA